jgi:hypothetical protein
MCSTMSLSTVAAEQVRIAYNSILPPFTEMKDGKPVGLVIEIVQAAAERAGYQVEFVRCRLINWRQR